MSNDDISQINENIIKKFGKEEFDSMISCQICGRKSHDLTTHIIRVHKMECKDYKEKYGNFRSPKYLQCQSERIKGNKNPGFNHGGSLSPFSETFYIERRGMTLEEAKAAVKYMYDTKKRIVSTNCVEYWTRRGFTEDDAKQKVKERQAVGSLANFQKRHGEEEGLQKWKDRQIKWQNTMKSKPLDERIRINKAKMGNRSYSKVSQVLFVSIYAFTSSISALVQTNNIVLLFSFFIISSSLYFR